MSRDDREKLAQWMISKGYSTGHGDTIEDLLKELEWQIAEFVDKAAAALDLLERHTVTIDGEFGYCRSIGELESAGALPQEIVNLRRAIARMTEGRL